VLVYRRGYSCGFGFGLVSLAVIVTEMLFQKIYFLKFKKKLLGVVTKSRLHVFNFTFMFSDTVHDWSRFSPPP